MVQALDRGAPGAVVDEQQRAQAVPYLESAAQVGSTEAGFRLDQTAPANH
jgi:hypothetical protein